MLIPWGLYWGFATAYVAEEKNHGGTRWFFMGFIFGIFGFLPIAACPARAHRRQKVRIDEEDEYAAHVARSRRKRVPALTRAEFEENIRRGP